MVGTRKTLPAKVDVAHLISSRVLMSISPRESIKEVLSKTN